MHHIIIIGFVWPEPNSSAAGSRMLQLIHLFLEQNWKITFLSAATESKHMFDLNDLGIKMISIKVNDKEFDKTIKELNPTVVLFDRFVTEEQFGWRVSKECPDALKILNTEDLHSLRAVRYECYKEQKEFEFSDLLNHDKTYRELASIYRCDLSILISDFELNLLENTFNIPSRKLIYLPFIFDKLTSETKRNWINYTKRAHFITIGNFRHLPNWHSILYLKKTLWPLIKKEVPEAELHIYGSYPPEKAFDLHNKKEGFLVKGWADDANAVMRNARVCLAPLQFGAGIKGKLAEAMLCGTPSVTTSIGSEGMLSEESDWNGFIIDDPEKFCKAAAHLYTNENVWKQSQQNGVEIINTRFQKSQFTHQFVSKIETEYKNLKNLRASNFIGNMLQHHSIRSTEFMSRWIEEKNKNKPAL